ncbi:MAG TPA: Fe-S cluster assembly protein SufD, partial [Porphyromonadaceae bacterium]|nr:Fe-S cluster assembly protein SufD [Porphyromonadaceae bacterium]
MIEQQYIDLFNDYRDEIDANSVAGLNRHRDAAFEAFNRSGFPTSKSEDYKHTDVSRVFDCDLGLNLRNVPVPVDPYEAFKCDVPNLNTNVYFLINDRFYTNGHHQGPLPKGVFVGSLQLFSETHPDIFERYYAKIGDYSGNGVVAYNTMFAQDGFVIYVPENVVIEKPLQLINILRGGVDLNVNRRILIVAEKNAQVKLLVCDHTVDDVQFIVTQVAEIVADRDAQVDFYELEENSVKVKLLNNVFAEQAENSNVTVSTITLHNGFTRNNYRFRLLGEYAEAHIGGLAICDKEQHVDNYAFLEHATPNCHSNELFKYALQERSTG